jgi:hypothetical protein
MMRRTLAIGALLGVVTGCATANDPSQWPARYHKAGVTPQQLTEDGAACLGAPTSPWTGTAVGVGGVGGVGGIGPLRGDNRMVDLDSHAECMKAKGYTVTP